MNWKDLGVPSPRSEPIPYSPLEWPETDVITFEDAQPSERSSTAMSFASLVHQRQTRYGFGPLSRQDLGVLLALTCKVKALGSCNLGFPLSKRPAPSAGAIHPIHVILHIPEMPVLYRYDPYAHALLELRCGVDTEQLRRAMNEIVEVESGVLLMFVAEPGLTCSKYENAASLIWRDAGVLQGYFSMAAEYMGLHYVPLGVTGEPWVRRIVDKGGVAGVGVALVGSPVLSGLVPNNAN